MAKVYVQEVSERNQPDGYAGLNSEGQLLYDQMPAALPSGGGNARVLIWDPVGANYEPEAYRTDTALPREFIGPVDPQTIGSIVGPVYCDRWTLNA